VKIHPTALIDPHARLAEDVEVGPFSCIGPEVEIGARTILQSHVIIEGAVRLGADNQIGHGAIIGGFFLADSLDFQNFFEVAF